MKNEYEQYENLINSRAWSFNRTTGLPFEELQAQGFLIFVQCQPDYDSSKSKFSTFLYTCLNNGLSHYCQTFNNKTVELNDKLCSDEQSVEDVIFWKQKLNNVTQETKQVLQLIFNSPTEICKTFYELEKTNPASARSHLREHLRDKGWKFKTIQVVFDEIKQLINSTI